MSEPTPASKAWHSWAEFINGMFARFVVIAWIGPLTQSRNRNLDAVSSLDPVAEAADVNEMFWPASSNVTQFMPETNLVSGTLLYVKVVFNIIPDDTKVNQRLLAKTLLSVGNSSSSDVQWEKIIIDKDFVRRFSTTPLRNCFFQAVGAVPIVSIHAGCH